MRVFAGDAEPGLSKTFWIFIERKTITISQLHALDLSVHPHVVKFAVDLCH